jgi:ATP-binding protein involved in chromosome partitioning
MAITKFQVLQALRLVRYPEFEKDIIELKMVENVKIEDENIHFDLIIPSENDPNQSMMESICINAINNYFKRKINITIKPVFHPGFKFPESFNALAEVNNIIAIASGKGGVGKSTIAVNLAVALSKTGASVGLIDADIFGPSIPKMFNSEESKPLMRKVGSKDVIIPVEKYGIKQISIGYFINPDNAAIWRGPMASNALKQLITETDWGRIDYLLIDLPPGTSDIHLTTVQTLAVTGALIVSTPQDIALADAIKGISMFQSDGINVPILGLVENMAWFTPEELPNNRYYIFGKEGCKKLAEKTGIPLLGQIPIVQSIREGSDCGRPSALNENSPIAKAFMDLAKNVIKSIEERNTKLPPAQKVEINKR